MSPSELAKLIGIELTPAPEANPARGVLAQYAGSYVAAGDRIVTLNLYEQPPARPPEDWLHALPDLRYLNLGACGLTRFDLRDAPYLEVLWLHDNPELTELKLPRRHDQLIRVDLSGCGLRRITWPECPKLEFLDCSRQADRSLMSFRMDRSAPALHYLDLSHNSLPDFTLPADCNELKILCLEHNQLNRVDFSGGIPALESLRLNDNQLATLPHEWADELAEVSQLYLGENRLTEDYLGSLQDASPRETVAIVRDILNSRRQAKEEKDTECKVLIVGNSGVGKTTLYHRLNGGKFADHISTDGVIIATHDWPKEAPKYRLQFWDFGGQDIYHATHRLFLQSSAVYLVAWDVDSEEKEYSTRPEDAEKGHRNFKLPYWLDYVYRSATGGEDNRRQSSAESIDAPVLVVQTKKARHAPRERPFINARFGPRFAYYRPGLAIESDPEKVASNDHDGYTTLELELRNALRKAKPEQSISASWGTLRRRLRERQEGGTPWIILDDYRELAQGVEAEIGTLGRNPLAILTDWLHRTGVVYYNPTVTGERIILDQRWATQAIYTILQRSPVNYYEIIKEDQDGLFSGAQLLEFWRAEKYLQHPGDEQLFEQFMLACELAYRIDGANEDTEIADRHYCAPELLPTEPKNPALLYGRRKNIAQRPGNWWHLRLYNEFLHTGIIRRLIIRLHGSGDPDRFWRDGLILRDEEGNYALAEVNATRDAVHIYCQKDGSELLKKLLHEIDHLPSLDQPERIWVSADGQREVELAQLRAARRKNRSVVKDQTDTDLAVTEFADFLRVDAALHHFDRQNVAPPEMVESSEEAPEIVKEPSIEEQQEPDVQSGDNRLWTIGLYSAVLPEFKKLDTENEADRITKIIRLRGKQFDDYQVFGSSGVATKDRIRHGVGKDAPSVLHFSGHGVRTRNKKEVTNTQGLNTQGVPTKTTCGIVLGDNKGQPRFISEQELYGLLYILRKHTTPKRAYPFLRLVFLNACHTADVARRISELHLTAIGVAGTVYDSKAIEFAATFYDELHQRGESELLAAFEIAGQSARVDYKMYRDGHLIGSLS